MLVADDAGTQRQSVHELQPAAVFRGWVIDEAWSGLRAAVGYGHSHDGLGPGDFHRELAATPAPGVPDSVAAQFVGDADHVVA